MYIFTEQEIRRCVKLNRDTIKVVENAFTDLADGKVTTPPIMRIDVPEHEGEVDVKSAYVKGREHFAIKISSGFFKNHLRGLPSGSGMMTLISAETGVPVAILLGNGYLTDVRTAAAGAVAANHLARENVQTAGIIGVGSQARYQAQALQYVRQYEKLIIYGRNEDRVKTFVEDMQSVLRVPVIAAQSPEEVLRDSDVVVTTTPARTPIVQSEWLHTGIHITAMGSDAEHKQELSPAVLQSADLVVCDLKSQCFRLGELHHAAEQGFSQEQVIELGEVTLGRHPGRTDDRQITVCDLTGTGVQDTAIADYAFTQLIAQGLGLRID